MLKKMLGAVSLLFVAILIGGCSPSQLIMGGIEAASMAADIAADASKERSEENISKENNTVFNPGVATEQVVRSILDANGKPDDELLFQDVTPAKKIIVYKRELTKGKGFKVFLFAFDQGKTNLFFVITLFQLRMNT